MTVCTAVYPVRVRGVCPHGNVRGFEFPWLGLVCILDTVHLSHRPYPLVVFYAIGQVI